MKTIRMAFSTGEAENVVVLGRGDAKQTPRDIAAAVEPKVRDRVGANGAASEITLEDYELLEDSNDETMESDYLTFHVNGTTEEPYCERNYGARFEHGNRPRARGPIGYSELP